MTARQSGHSRRLETGGRIDRSQRIGFTFDGRRYAGYAGDTLASALIANEVDIVGRSFKYSRPRGVLAAGVEEPNAIVQLGASESRQVPNVRATEQPLYAGLVASTPNGWPSARHDAMAIFGRLFGDLMGPGFYYKTFLRPAWVWRLVEPWIRRAAGLGRSSSLPDPDRYDHVHHHVDVLVIGAGPAGLAAAREALTRGASVLLCDEQSEPGGSLLSSTEAVHGMSASEWLSQSLQALDAHDRFRRLQHCTATGLHDNNFLTLWERRADALGERLPRGATRHRLHKVRAGVVVLATGAHERPLVYANNDLPGCMIAGAVSTYIRRYAVVPGSTLVVSTTNDAGYGCAFDWQDAGREVVAIVDARAQPAGAALDEAYRRGLPVITGSAVVEAIGSMRVDGVWVAPIDVDRLRVTGEAELYDADTVATSGGFSPVVHLSSHTGTRPVWREDLIGFVPGQTRDPLVAVGSVAGAWSLAACIDSGERGGRDACRRLRERTANVGDQHAPVESDVPLAAGRSLGARAVVEADEREPADALVSDASAHPAPAPVAEAANESTTVDAGSGLRDDRSVAPAVPLFLVPHPKGTARAPKQFVDYQNDVTAAGIETAVLEGFESIEHVKRYTAMGFGTDQGKTGNINGMAIVARARGESIADTGTTVFRPNYTPVTFGAVAGAHVDELFDAKRFTPLHARHLDRGAVFEPVGQWMRPHHYPLTGETAEQAVRRECLAVRHAVGLLDASTLGKIDIQGPDAREFLGRVYTNAWQKLEPGRCRYGLMCGEDGMVFDDGVTACLADNHFHMTTTSGGAARVLSWLELWQQTEWPELEVYFTSTTDQWATLSIAGPESRHLLARLTDDIDLQASAFPFMSWRSGHVAGVPARVFRISFTGELSYEINVPASQALHLWDALFDARGDIELVPYGTEAMHVLRAEKGFIIVGQDTDGSVTPFDLGMDWCVAMQKPFSFLGKRGMHREDCQRSNRKQLVGLVCAPDEPMIPEGSQAVADPDQPVPMTMLGHVSSSYLSPVLGHPIALALIVDGRNRMGDTLWFPQADGRRLRARVCEPLWVDPEGERLRG